MTTTPKNWSGWLNPTQRCLICSVGKNLYRAQFINFIRKISGLSIMSNTLAKSFNFCHQFVLFFFRLVFCCMQHYYTFYKCHLPFLSIESKFIDIILVLRWFVKKMCLTSMNYCWNRAEKKTEKISILLRMQLNQSAQTKMGGFRNLNVFLLKIHFWKISNILKICFPRNHRSSNQGIDIV
jgi:hypothetical protein